LRYADEVSDALGDAEDEEPFGERCSSHGFYYETDCHAPFRKTGWVCFHIRLWLMRRGVMPPCAELVEPCELPVACRCWVPSLQGKLAAGGSVAESVPHAKPRGVKTRSSQTGARTTPGLTTAWCAASSSTWAAPLAPRRVGRCQSLICLRVFCYYVIVCRILLTRLELGVGLVAGSSRLRIGAPASDTLNVLRSPAGVKDSSNSISSCTAGSL
jgi:hypothetical protein